MIVDLSQVRAVDILVVFESLEASAIRGALEAFGIQVRMHYIGNVKHLVSLLQSSRYLHKTLILSCHGNRGDLLIPELAPELEANMPYHKKLTPRDLREFLHLDNQTVINTGCCLGSKSFAESFLVTGAAAYIGVADYIDSCAILSFTLAFLYLYLAKGLSVESAFDRAKSLDDETTMMKLWQKKDIITSLL